MTIHNPYGAVLTDAEINAGWRFCFLEELEVARPMDALYKCKSTAGQPWRPTSSPGVPINAGDLVATTYITQRPIPVIDPIDQLVKFLS